MENIAADRGFATPDTNRDNILPDINYVFGERGYVYTSPSLAHGITVRHTAVILMTSDYRAFEVTPRGSAPVRANCVVMAPLYARSLRAESVPLLSINIAPLHPSFGVFRALRQCGLMVLDRHAFNGLDTEASAMCKGDIAYERARDVFEQFVTEAGRQLPPAPATDPRAESMMRMVDKDPEVSIDQLALHFGHSPTQMSRLFAAAVGMSLRDYRDWLRLRAFQRNLLTKRSLTDVAYESGFADSPQLSRAVKRWFGHSPSQARDPSYVRIVSRCTMKDKTS